MSSVLSSCFSFTTIYNVHRSLINEEIYQPDPETMLSQIHTMVQDVHALQMKFDEVEDGEMKWALDEDIVGKVILCHCK